MFDTQLRSYGDSAFPATVLSAFEDGVARHPHRIACVDKSGETDYAWLDAAASEVASALAGAGPVVAVACARSRHLLAALFGVMRAGRAYLPLDATQPLARQRAILADAAVTTVLSDATPEVASDLGIDLVVLGESLGEGAAVSPAAVVDGADAAYVIFTSGSTGRPKGVQVAHEALAHCVARVGEMVDFRPGETWLALTAPSFDIAALEYLVPLTHGGTVHLASSEEAVDPAACAVLLGSGIDVVQATPTMWRAVVESGWLGQPELRVLCGGEAMDVELARLLMARAGRVWNVYGPTETTIWSTAIDVADVNLDALSAGDNVPLGRPFDGESCVVVTADGRPAAQGQVGELWISGAGLADGYLNDPEKTAQCFVHPEFAPTVLYYRTGDLACVDTSGQLLFRGRADHQVKVRGHRIELGEVEAVLHRVPGVLDCAVLYDEQGTTGGRLVAVVHGKPSGESSALEAACHAELPEVMVPTAFIFAPSWPRLTSGKVDRTTLATLIPEAPVVDASAVGAAMPTTPLSAVADVAAAFSAVLGIPVGDIDHGSDFFRLGGHSLMATRVVARLRARGHVLTLRDVFLARTVDSLARRLDREPGQLAIGSEQAAPAQTGDVGGASARELRATRSQRQFSFKMP